MDRRTTAVVSSAVLGVLTGLVSASPYASSITESSGTVTFTLNEAATNVTIIRDGVPTSLGALALGSHTFARDSAASYSIVVSGSGTAGYQSVTGLTDSISGISNGTPIGAISQISDDNNIRNSFHGVRGLAVNRNPNNGASFGLVYVANGNTGTTNGFVTPSRTVGDGIYINGADGSDPLGQANTARTGGIADFTSSTNAPFRLAIDAAGFLYASNWADSTGTVYRIDSTVTTGANLLAGGGSSVPLAPIASHNHGSIPALVISGSSAGGNLTLWTIDEDLTPSAPAAQNLNSLWEYNINGGTTSGFNGIPTKRATVLVSNQNAVLADVARGPDGKFYVAQNDTTNGELNSLFVLNPDYSIALSSRSETIARGYDEDSVASGTQDVLRGIRGIDVSPDGQWLAIMRDDSTSMVVPLIDGLPDLPNRRYLPTFDSVNFGREIAFDAAGNLYAVSGFSGGASPGAQAMRIFSPSRVSLTTWNSDGTFSYRNDPEWFVDASGNSSGTGNWLQGYSPNGAGETARFGSAITAPATVTLNVPTTLGTMKFDSAQPYTIAGTSTLTLSTFGEPRIFVTSGSHSITAPTVVNQSLLIKVDTGAGLAMAKMSMLGGTNGSQTLTKTGAGSLALNNIRIGTFTVQGGDIQIIAGTIPNSPDGVSNVRKLTIPGTAAVPTSKIDLTNNSIVLDYETTSLLNDVKSLIKSGYNGGAWNGNGLNSSSAAASPSTGKTALGYREASALLGIGGGVFLGQTVDDTAIVVKYTYAGDATLDGIVDVGDLGVLATNWQAAAIWDGGDFDYNGSVDVNDLGLLASNWQQGVGSPLGPGSLADALASLGLPSVSVPEPATAALLGLAAFSMLRRARRAS